MMISAAHRVSHIVLTLALLVSLALLGFGHRVHAHPAPMDAATLAFLEAGGELSDLCDMDADDGADLSECPACTLAKGFMLADAGTDLPTRSVRFEHVVWPHPKAQPSPHSFDFSRTTRAPPRT